MKKVQIEVTKSFNGIEVGAVKNVSESIANNLIERGLVKLKTVQKAKTSKTKTEETEK